MNKIKFVIFAHPSISCGNSRNNFIKDDLKLDYAIDEQEFSIGLKSDKAEQILKYDDSYDIFLFDDTEGIPLSDSVFFEAFCQKLYELKDVIEIKIILHRGSGWNFKSIDISENSFHSKFKSEILWLSSLKENENIIEQSHTENEVFGKELKDIAIAILSKDVKAYSRAIKELNNRFIDKDFEKLLEPFATVSPYETTNTLGINLKEAKKNLQLHIEKYLKNKVK